MDAASRSRRRRQLLREGGGGGGADAVEGQGGERARDRAQALAVLLQGNGLLLEGHENIQLIHHLIARGLILLPHVRVRLRLWGI